MAPRSSRSSKNNSEHEAGRLANRIASKFLKKKFNPDFVEVVFIPNAELRALKARFYSKAQVPAFVDVLAFPRGKFPHPERPGFLGELYLNRSLTKSKRGELARMVIHGTLHLLGYDHMKKGARIEMERFEQIFYKQYSSGKFN